MRAPSSCKFWTLMGPIMCYIFEKLAFWGYQIWYCEEMLRGGGDMRANVCTYVAKDIYALLAHFFREHNLRTPSAKFLCIKFCRPESFDFLCLCHQYNILIVSEMSPIGPNCREESVCFGFGVELHYNELGWESQKWSADQNSSSSIFRETKIFSTAKRCSYNSPTQRSQPNPIPLPIQSHL